MRNCKLNFFISLAVFQTLSCASSELRLQSTPIEAKVTIYNSNGESQELGPTPLNLKGSELKVKAPFFIEVTKTGFQTKSIFVPYFNSSTQLNAQVTLSEKLESTASGSQLVTSGDELVKEISLIHNLISKKEFNEAQSRLLNLTTKYPSYPSLWSLSGNVYYLQRKWDLAVEAYSKALDLDPSAQEVKKMLNRVKALKGGG